MSPLYINHHAKKNYTRELIGILPDQAPSDDDAGYKIHSIVLEKPLPNDELAAATIINQNIESLIRKVPHQYMWGYNRYKHPAGALPPTIESVTTSLISPHFEEKN
ncbi:hypothetical protein ACTFIZ_012907 [Dictyostelium cf. discoideum]